MFDQHKQVKSRQERDREDADNWRNLLALVKANSKRGTGSSVVITAYGSGFDVDDYYGCGSIFPDLPSAIKDAIERGQR